MLGEIEACVKRMVDVGIADAHDVDVWRQVFEQSSVSKRHVDSGTVYLALAPEDKRKDCFRNLGFSPNIGLFSEWALDNGLDPLARHMSWRLNSQCQYRFGDGEFFVMSPGVVENFQCEHPCKYVDLEMRVGPEAAVGLLTMYEDLVNPKRADSVCEVMELDNDVDPVVLPDEPMLETSYLLAFRPDVRHEAFQQLGLGISLLQLVSAEFPFQDVQALEQLRCDVVEDFPDLLCAGDDVLISIAEETRFTLHRHGGTGMSMHSVIQTLCAWDQYARYIRERYDDVDYGLRYDGRIYMETCHYDMHVAEPLYDTEVDPGIPVAVSFGDGNGEHYCSLHGYVDVVPFGLRESFRALLGTESSFSAMVQLVGGRFVDWTCLCEDRCYHDFRSVVFVRYKGSGVDRVVDAVWYGLERTGKVPMFVWVKRVVLDFNAPGLGVIGLSSCKRVGLDSLPSIVARDKTVTGGVSFVKFQYDSNRYQGDTFGWSDGYDDLENQIRGCDCGHGHTV